MRVASTTAPRKPGPGRLIAGLSLAAVLGTSAGLAIAQRASRDPDDALAMAPPNTTHYVSLGRDALDAALHAAARTGHAPQLLATGEDALILALDDRELAILSEEMHARHDRCGGFMVHDSLADAHAAIEPARLVRPALPDYTLDRDAAVGAVLPTIGRARIRDAIAALSAMPNRYYQSETGAAASTWLRDRWRALTTRPDVTVELVDHGYAQKSVVMTIPGTTRRDEVVVIGGHLDSIAIGRGSSLAPGADDDASGIATVTEVARALLAADYRPARTIQFMAYAAEEVGLRGSLKIARDYQQRRVNVVGALQLDMTNFHGSDRDIWLISDFTSAAQNNFLIELIERYTGATWGMDRCGYACSDHASWHRTGVPASMPFEARSRDRNQQIHTRNDTLETSDANAAHAEKFARLAAAYAIELGKGELGGPALRPAPAPAPAVAPAREPQRDSSAGALASLALLVLAVGLARRASGI